MRPLSFYMVQFLRQKALALPHPVLVWSAAPTNKPDKVWKTQAPLLKPRPIAGEPVVFELVKGEHQANAFAMGVTLGRAESNDICIDDESVSRFHCYFQVATSKAAAGEWQVIDADSSNGSAVNGAVLSSRQAVSLANGDHLRLGDVDLNFHDVAGFERFLASTAPLPP